MAFIWSLPRATYAYALQPSVSSEVEVSYLVFIACFHSVYSLLYVGPLPLWIVDTIQTVVYHIPRPMLATNRIDIICFPVYFVGSSVISESPNTYE